MGALKIHSKMTDPRFVVFSNEEIRSFLEENENQNTLCAILSDSEYIINRDYDTARA